MIPFLLESAPPDWGGWFDRGTALVSVAVAVGIAYLRLFMHAELASHQKEILQMVSHQYLPKGDGDVRLREIEGAYVVLAGFAFSVRGLWMLLRERGREMDQR